MKFRALYLIVGMAAFLGVCQSANSETSVPEQINTQIKLENQIKDGMNAPVVEGAPTINQEAGATETSASESQSIEAGATETASPIDEAASTPDDVNNSDAVTPTSEETPTEVTQPNAVPTEGTTMPSTEQESSEIKTPAAESTIPSTGDEMSIPAQK